MRQHDGDPFERAAVRCTEPPAKEHEMRSTFYSRLRWLLDYAGDVSVPLIRPSATDIFEHSDWRAHDICTDPALDGRQRVELLLLLDSIVRVALAARGETRQVLTTRPAPTSARRWIVRGSALEAVA